MKKILIPFLFFISVQCFAQQPNSTYKAVDDYVTTLGKLYGLTMATISEIVTKKFKEKTDKARAIFFWITQNIAYDLKAGKQGNTDKNNSTFVLKSRKAIASGYATLFQDMCSAANIRCLTIDGFIKNNTDEINQKKPEINHTWAVVQLGQSPESWYYVDVALASGFTDKDFKVFTKQFNDAYFFANKPIFNLEHFPDNEVWKLGPGVKSKKDFYEMAVVKRGIHDFGITKFLPSQGLLKLKIGKTAVFNFTTNGNTVIEKVEIIFGEGKSQKRKQANFTLTGNTLNISYDFKEEDTYPITILANGKEIISYLVEVAA
jgi:Transglutaminase-like superfamily